MDAFFRALFSPSSLNKWQIQNLDYNVYTALAVLFGWCGLDLLYLGSPLGAVIKAFFNIFTFGYWWFHDALMAVAGAPQVKLYGTTIPAVGPVGIGACRFRADKPEGVDPEALKKHMNFAIYACALIAAGWLGIDQLVLGESFNCFIHVAAFMSVIGIPLALAAYAIRSYMLMFNTESVIDQNWSYFGAARPKDRAAECPNLVENTLVATTDVTAAVIATTPGLSSIGDIIILFNTNLKRAIGTMIDIKNVVVEAIMTLSGIAGAAGTLSPPPTEAFNKAGSGVAKGAATAPTQAPSSTAPSLAQQPPPPAPSSTAPSAPPSAPPSVGNLASAYQSGRGYDQVGGFTELIGASPPSWVPMTAGLLALTVGFIVVSSIVLSFRRSFQNGSKKAPATKATASPANTQQPDQDDDVPPEPGVPGVVGQAA